MNKRETSLRSLIKVIIIKVKIICFCCKRQINDENTFHFIWKLWVHPKNKQCYYRLMIPIQNNRSFKIKQKWILKIKSMRCAWLCLCPISRKQTFILLFSVFFSGETKIYINECIWKMHELLNLSPSSSSTWSPSILWIYFSIFNSATAH